MGVLFSTHLTHLITRACFSFSSPLSRRERMFRLSRHSRAQSVFPDVYYDATGTPHFYFFLSVVFAGEVLGMGNLQLNKTLTSNVC
jgi:hypothetical protein